MTLTELRADMLPKVLRRANKQLKRAGMRPMTVGEREAFVAGFLTGWDCYPCAIEAAREVVAEEMPVPADVN